jgi:hypothetical protein
MTGRIAAGLFSFLIAAGCLLPASVHSQTFDLLGKWQSVRCSANYNNEPNCSTIWRNYREDGSVEIIEGNAGGVRRRDICGYRIEGDRLYEICPYRDETESTYEFDGKKLTITQITYAVLPTVNLSNTYEYVRQNTPEAKLLEMRKMPSNIPEAIRFLLKEIPEDKLDIIRRRPTQNATELYIGYWMRNSLGLLMEYELEKSIKRIGITNPEDTSRILLDILHDLLNNKPANLRDIVSRNLQFYVDATIRETGHSPGSKRRIRFLARFVDPGPGMPSSEIFAGESEDKTIWSYNPRDGIKVASEDLKARFNDRMKLIERLDREIDGIRADFITKKSE